MALRAVRTPEFAAARDLARAASSVRVRNIWPCLVYLAIEFARPMAWVPALGMIKPGMLVAFWGLGSVLLEKDRPPLPKPLKYMLGLLALMVLHVPLATNNAWALWGMEDYAILILGGVLPLAMIPSDLGSVKTLIGAYVALHVPMAVHGLLHGGTGQGGWITDENDLALALNAGLGVAIFLFLETKSALRKFWIVGVMALLVAGVVLTMSRGGFVGLATLGLYVFAVSPRKVLIASILLVAVLGLALMAPASYWNEVRSIETADQQGDTGAQRLYLWGMAWHMFLDHPVFGVGTRNYGIEAPNYENKQFAEASGQHMWGRVAHSLYFTLLAEQGSVGVTLFLLTVLWTFRSGWRIRRRGLERPDDPETATAAMLATGLLAGMVGVLVTGAFITVIYYPVIWVLAGLMAALDRVAVPRGETDAPTASGRRPLRTFGRREAPAPGRSGR